ncbi:MAG: EamA family transporter [Gaiellales bacterium]
MSGRSVPATWLVLGAVASMQFGAALGATLFDEIGPIGASFVRVALAAAVLGLVSRPTFRGRTRRELVTAVVFGLVLTGMNVCFYLALDRIPQGIAVTLEMTGPLVLALALSRRALDACWVAVAAAGIALLSGGDWGSLDSAGVAFALAAATLWALYILLAARVGRSFPGLGGLALGMAVGAVAVAPFGIVEAGSALLDGRVLAIGLAVALLSSVIPYSLELQALRSLAARVFGVLMSLEPAAAALAGFLVLDQRLSALQALAIVLVIVASAGIAITARRRLS